MDLFTWINISEMYKQTEECSASISLLEDNMKI